MWAFLATLWTVFHGFILTVCALIFLLTVAGIFAGGTTWTKYVALAFDFFWNVMTGGQIGVTISSRAGMAEMKGKRWGKVLSCSLSRLEPDHCKKAIHADIDRAKAVIAALAPYDDRITGGRG